MKAITEESDRALLQEICDEAFGKDDSDLDFDTDERTDSKVKTANESTLAFLRVKLRDQDYTVVTCVDPFTGFYWAFEGLPTMGEIAEAYDKDVLGATRPLA